MSAEPTAHKKSKPTRHPASDLLNAVLVLGLVAAPFSGQAKDIYAWWMVSGHEHAAGSSAQQDGAPVAPNETVVKQEASPAEARTTPETQSAAVEPARKTEQPSSSGVPSAIKDAANGRPLRGEKGAAVDTGKDVNVPPIVRQRPKEVVATTTEPPAKANAKQGKAKAK
jgi:hypothetical protein